MIICSLAVQVCTVIRSVYRSMMRSCPPLQQAKHPQHAKKPSIVLELGSELERPSTDDLAREVYNYTGETGTYRYMAPEVFRHEPYNAKVCCNYKYTQTAV